MKGKPKKKAEWRDLVEETNRRFEEMMAAKAKQESPWTAKKVVHSVRSGSSPEVRRESKDSASPAKHLGLVQVESQKNKKAPESATVKSHEIMNCIAIEIGKETLTLEADELNQLKMRKMSAQHLIQGHYEVLGSGNPSEINLFNDDVISELVQPKKKLSKHELDQLKLDFKTLCIDSGYLNLRILE